MYDDFPILHNKNIIYFDNAATTLKPGRVIQAMNDYLNYYTSNIHRGLYTNAIVTDYLYDSTREVVKEFIHCNSPKEVIFTSGTTHSINLMVFGYMKYHLQAGDEVLLSKAEHASNILPWLRLAEEIGIVVRYIPLSDDYSLAYENVVLSITEKTKVISLAQVTNVIGDCRDIEKIGKLCSSKGILFHVDGAQSVPHMKVDFQASYIDFLSFSGHKMCGPTGVGVLVAREALLKEMVPVFYGGGMNLSFDSTGKYQLVDYPSLFEAGTPPILEVLGLKSAIEYLREIGMDKIQDYESELKKYLLSKLETVPDIVLYNRDSSSGILVFNIRGVSSADVSKYLNSFHICVRAGSHCSKMLKENMDISSTVRVSLYFYNTKEEIDYFISVLQRCRNVFHVV